MRRPFSRDTLITAIGLTRQGGAYSMRHYRLAMLAFFFIVAVGALSDDIDIPIPEPVELGSESSLVIPDFRPVGWSQDGKLAWVEVLHVEGRGGDDVTYVIFDAVEDSVVWSNRDKSSWEQAEDESVLEISWELMGGEFTQ